MKLYHEYKKVEYDTLIYVQKPAIFEKLIENHRAFLIDNYTQEKTKHQQNIFVIRKDYDFIIKDNIHQY